MRALEGLMTECHNHQQEEEYSLHAVKVSSSQGCQMPARMITGPITNDFRLFLCTRYEMDIDLRLPGHFLVGL